MAIAKVFFDQDMRLGLDGFSEILRKKKIIPQREDFYLFMNRRQNYIKIMWHAKYIVLYRKPKGTISLGEIKEIPKFFKNFIITPTISTQLAMQLKEVYENAVLKVS